jgi:hypothetical protein
MYLGDKMKIHKKEVSERIFSLQFKNQYDACSTFMRVAEFYESPFKQIRGKHFSLEQYMDVYAKFRGNFTYTVDWGGFNIPGKVFINFFELFKNDLLKKEKHLKSLFEDEFADKKDFYVIAHSEAKNSRINKLNIETTLGHEVAHGKFYLNPLYKRSCLNLIETLPKKTVKEITTKLLAMGYTKGVIKDEIQAYLATSTYDYIKKLFGLRMKKDLEKFQSLFLQFVE